MLTLGSAAQSRSTPSRARTMGRFRALRARGRCSTMEPTPPLGDTLAMTSSWAGAAAVERPAAAEG